MLWQRSLEDAIEFARAENHPLLVAVNMDGESASDRIVHEEYRDPAFVAATRECVCLVAGAFRHNRRDYDDEGRRIPCPRLGEVTCGEHMALEPLLFERFLSDGERVALRHTLILPRGEKAWDLSPCFDHSDIDRALFDSVGTPAAGTAAALGSETSWTALAALRDNRERSSLEAALGGVQDEATLGAALATLPAAGDASSLDALRICRAAFHGARTEPAPKSWPPRAPWALRSSSGSCCAVRWRRRERDPPDRHLRDARPCCRCWPSWTGRRRPPAPS